MKETSLDNKIEAICTQLQRFSNASMNIDIKSFDSKNMIRKLFEYERRVRCRDGLYQAGEYEMEMIQGRKFLFSVIDAKKVIPEALSLSEIDVLKKVAIRLYHPENIVLNVSAFFRNPLGKGIQPHQDLAYEDKEKRERILSLNISLVETSYNDGGLGYYNIAHGEILEHKFCMRSATWILVPSEIRALADDDIHDAARAHLHTSFNVHKAKGVRRDGRRGIVLRLIATCYGSKI